MYMYIYNAHTRPASLPVRFLWHLLYMLLLYRRGQYRADIIARNAKNTIKHISNNITSCPERIQGDF